MIREEVLNAKLITITFIFSSFANVSDLHINTDFNDDDCHYNCDLLMMIILLRLLISLLSVFSPLLGL